MHTVSHSLGAVKNWFFKRSLRTKLLILVIIVVIGWLTIPKILGTNKSAVQYQTAQVTKGTIISSVTESGNISSIGQAAVGSPTSGVMTEIYVKDGDQVTQGQNLFKVKSIATAQEIASAYASYLGAQNNLQSAQAQLNALQSALFVANQKFVNDRGVANPTDQQKADPVYIEENAQWLQAEANYKNQTTAIAQAQAALNNAALSYQATQDSTVTAPISGTVANITVQPGDQVTASSGNLSSELTSSSSTSNSPILYIGNFTAPYVKVQASEVDVPKIKAGQKATITLDAFPTQTFVGKVSQVDTVGTNSSGVITYNVFISLIAPPTTIKPEMSATVTIETARKDDVLSVPSSAIQTINGQTEVRILQNGKITFVPVTTGITSDTDTEITSGLQEGQSIVTGVMMPAAASGSTSSSPFSGTSLRGFGGAGGGGGTFFRAGGGGGGARGG